jgi:hypothetical protein
MPAVDAAADEVAQVPQVEAEAVVGVQPRRPDNAEPRQALKCRQSQLRMRVRLLMPALPAVDAVLLPVAAVVARDVEAQLLPVLPQEDRLLEAPEAPQLRQAPR